VSPESLAGWTRLAETLGYHFVMISDHVALTPDVVARYPAPFYDPFATLAWLAGLTHRVELGTTVVILPYRHPLHTARLAANVDRLSGGRFILGVGVGWARQEFEALGLPFERRGAMSDDYLAAIKTAWTSDPASHAGSFVTFRDVRTAPRPVRAPHPPLWVGGASDAALRRADLEALAELGASAVLLDTYADDPEATRHHETAWRMLATLAEQVLDLPRDGLR